MMTALIIALMILAAAAFTLYRNRRSLPEYRVDYLSDPPPFRGLFDDAPAETRQSPECDALLERAASGDLTTLDEAHASGDGALYRETLDALTRWADCQEKLNALVSRVSNNEEMRASPRLAAALIERYEDSPNRRSTIEMLHIAAKSADADSLRHAVEATLKLWQKGRLADLGAKELSEVFESQYWALDSEARRSGAGFALRRRLAEIRRALAATHNSPESPESLESLKSGKGVKPSDSQDSPDSIDSQDL